jgi:hypothetical protein
MLATALTFGVEIECYSPITRDAIAAKLNAAGVPARAYNHAEHATTSGWKVVTDGSLGRNAPAGMNGIEVVSPILRGEEGIAQLTTVCNTLTAIGCVVNKDCGLHVHVGARGASVAQLRNACKMFAKYESQFDAVVASSRRGDANRYALSNVNILAGSTLEQKFSTLDSARTVEALGKAMNGGFVRVQYSPFRYRKMNLQSMATHGTVEFRQHAGSTDAAKIVAWVKLVTGFMATAMSVRSVAPVAGTFEDFTRKVDRSTAEFFANRRAHFGA